MSDTTLVIILAIFDIALAFNINKITISNFGVVIPVFFIINVGCLFLMAI